jgi:uncharacterized protein (TIGR04168 family)
VGGDHGDRDFAAAIQQAETLGKSVAFVTFGHMHHRLRHLTAQRDRYRHTHYTTYLNAACVPRIIHSSRTNTTNRCFTIATLQNGQLKDAGIVWLNDRHQIVHEDPLISRKI